MSDVPEEICVEILLKLPVKQLLRCRCVSKSWKCLIDSDQFIKHHLDLSKKIRIIVGGFDLYSTDFDLLTQTNRATFKPLRHPLFHRSKSPLVEIIILGSCDGLLALKNDENNDTIVWNPLIRRFQEVPYPRIEFPRYISGIEKIVYGFGYDAVSNDYKLVRMIQYFQGFTAVKIYSLKSNSWRRKPNFPYSLGYNSSHGVFLDGALHWIVFRKVTTDAPVILMLAAYDLGTEEVRLIPLPEIAGNYSRVLASLGGCLCLVYHDLNDGSHEVWVMKEYGVEESWSILFTVDPCNVRYMRPIAYSRCGRKVFLVMNNNLVLYDLDTKSIYSPMVRAPLHSPSEMSVCLQSLVLLNGGTSDFELLTKKKQPKGNKTTSSTPRNASLAKNRTRVLPAKSRPPWR